MGVPAGSARSAIVKHVSRERFLDGFERTLKEMDGVTTRARNSATNRILCESLTFAIIIGLPRRYC